MSGFRVGDEVVCVDDRLVINTGFTPITPLEAGRAYTVSGVYYREAIRSVCVLLVEQANDFRGLDLGYRASRFRPVHRTKTDLSIEAFSTIKPGYEEPKRVERVKKGVGV